MCRPPTFEQALGVPSACCRKYGAVARHGRERRNHAHERFNVETSSARCLRCHRGRGRPGRPSDASTLLHSAGTSFHDASFETSRSGHPRTRHGRVRPPQGRQDRRRIGRRIVLLRYGGWRFRVRAPDGRARVRRRVVGRRVRQDSRGASGVHPEQAARGAGSARCGGRALPRTGSNQALPQWRRAARCARAVLDSRTKLHHRRRRGEPRGTTRTRRGGHGARPTAAREREHGGHVDVFRRLALDAPLCHRRCGDRRRRSDRRRRVGALGSA